MNIAERITFLHHMSVYPAENVIIKKTLWNTSPVYWKVSGLKLESTIITRCFSPAEEKMLAWHWKENHYNHIYIKKKKMRRNLKYTFLPELREFVLDMSGFSDQYNLITWRQIASEHDQRLDFLQYAWQREKSNKLSFLVITVFNWVFSCTI